MTFYDNTWLSLDLSAVVCLRMKRGVRKVMPTGMPEHTPPRMAPGIRAPGMVPLPVCACMAPRAAETAPRGSGGGGGQENDAWFVKGILFCSQKFKRSFHLLKFHLHSKFQENNYCIK